MHSALAAANITTTGAGIVSDVMREIGGPLPIAAEQLAALIPLRLLPQCGEANNDNADDDGDGYVGAIRYDARAAAATQERAIAFGCALWLVQSRGFDMHDAELVEYVACALCGLPKLPVKVSVTSFPDLA